MKARLKTIVLSALGAISVFTAVTVSSCKNDKCKAIVCAYGGVCTGGTCVCPTGYEGPQCETISRDKYLGTWIVTEDGTLTDAAQYSVSVNKGDNITELSIKNFHNLFVQDVKAYINHDTIYVPQQPVDNIYTVSGNGYIIDDKYYGKNGKLVLKYIVKDNAGNVDDFGIDSGDPALWNK